MSVYYATGLLCDEELRLSNSTEQLLGTIITGYNDLETEADRAASRYDYVAGAAHAVQLALIEAAVLAGSWSYDTAPTWERDRLLANKRGPAPSSGSLWSCSVPLVLVRKSRSTRISVAGNVLVVQPGSATQTLIALTHLGVIDAGHLNGPAQTKEPYL